MKAIDQAETLIWAKNNFDSVQLFDRRRTQRLINIASQLAAGNGQSLSRLFDRWYDTKALYNLVNLEIMTPETIQKAHYELTYDNIIDSTGDVLAIEDSSEFEWNGQEPIEGLGPIGSGRTQDQGFILHSTLAIEVLPNANKDTYNLNLLGLANQEYYVRSLKEEKRKKRSINNQPLETDLWRKLLMKKSIPAEAANRVFRVCDRGADIYEVVTETQEYGCNYIIRVSHDRKVLSEDPTVDNIGLFKSMREMPSMGLTSIVRRGRSGIKKRVIQLGVKWQKVQLRAPSRPGAAIGKLPPLESFVVHVSGIDPETNELIEWFLYTGEKINDLEGAIKIVQYYAIRWVIEDYHKALKTGMKAEELQLESGQALMATIAIMSIVALRLIDLRERLRINPDRPAEESGFSDFELKVLSAYLQKTIKTVYDVAMAIGRLGGHKNRKGDGMPGMLTLWDGFRRFLHMVEGAQLASKLIF
jgi:hypothetical protein